jgi:hypothetical protein
MRKMRLNDLVNSILGRYSLKFIGFTMSFVVLFSVLSLTALAGNSIKEIKELNVINAKRISGVVVSETGEPVAGANVTVKGANVGVATDANGKFSIEASEGEFLIVSHVAYETVEVLVGSNQNLVIKLKHKSTEMEQAVKLTVPLEIELKAAENWLLAH